MAEFPETQNLRGRTDQSHWSAAQRRFRNALNFNFECEIPRWFEAPAKEGVITNCHPVLINFSEVGIHNMTGIVLCDGDDDDDDDDG